MTGLVRTLPLAVPSVLLFLLLESFITKKLQRNTSSCEAAITSIPSCRFHLRQSLRGSWGAHPQANANT